MSKYYISKLFNSNGLIQSVTVEVSKEAFKRASNQKALATKQRKIARAERII